MATKKYPRGSEWRKWDLHIHTPKSICNNYGGDTDLVWDKYIEALERLPQEVSVIGINDYYFIDGYEKVMQYRKKDRLKNIDKIFPVLEFRIDTFGSGNENKLQKINLHILFDLNEEDLDNEIKKVREEFIGMIPLTSLERHKTKKLSIENLISEGGTLQDGFANLIPSTKTVFDIINSETWRNKVFLFLGYKEWSNLEKNQQLKPFKEDLYSKVNAFFTSNYASLGKSQEWLDEFGEKRLLHSLDIHDFSILDTANRDVNNEFLISSSYFCNTWIKADPTFEGLKQIIYEPESRVRIQEDNPEFEREKCPFTSIYIPNETKVFSDDDDIKFASTNLPLNNSLVSIIGGRGTGKSQLINYLASAFNRNNNPGKYNLCSDITIGRKASLTEEAKEFKVSDEPNAPFMYIAQSQIKELVEKKDKLSRNVLETIDVTDEYKQTADYSKGIDESINEYDRIIKTLKLNGRSTEERKKSIEKGIKKYNDFIQNITSEKNQQNLSNYKNYVQDLREIEFWQMKINDQYKKNEKFITDLNESIETWNEKFGVSMPLANIDSTQKYIKEDLLTKLEGLHQEKEGLIKEVKECFAEYKGDLTTLLSNVTLYQTRVSELTEEKEEFEQEENKYNILSVETFKKHGESIKTSIECYTKLIADKWNAFKGESDNTVSNKKELLNVILQKGMGVEATINFDKEEMYNLLLEGLDGRSYNLEKLQNTLSIKTIDDFYNFICQTGTKNAFSSDIKEDLRRRILVIFYKEYTKFISIGVNVTLNDKPITKLSYGQQGTVYLRLQLAANLFSETIIYDQPEDDLDNEFISDELISIFRTLKKYRQIIIVSHNANLVVNSDSEQIIVAKNTDGILSYSSGSLEDSYINLEVCRVLEGGKKAFEDRERKYILS